jgi:hypothetical protein
LHSLVSLQLATVMAIVVGYAAEADRGQRGKTAGAVA